MKLNQNRSPSDIGAYPISKNNSNNVTSASNTTSSKKSSSTSGPFSRTNRNGVYDNMEDYWSPPEFQDHFVANDGFHPDHNSELLVASRSIPVISSMRYVNAKQMADKQVGFYYCLCQWFSKCASRRLRSLF